MPQSTIERYISWKNSYAQRAAECYRIWIVRFYDHVQKSPELWEADDFVKFSLDLQQKNSIKTVQFALTAVKDHCRWLRNMKIADPPLEMIKKPKGKAKSYKPIPRDKFELIVSNIDVSTDYGIRDALIFWMFWNAGMRVSELCSMNVEQLDLFDKSAVIGTKKGHAEEAKLRKVFWGEEAQELLLKYLEIRKKYTHDGALFVNIGPYDHGERMATRAVQKVVRKHGLAVGIESRPHQIRHSFAINRYRNGADIKFIQWALGHESLRTTETYLQVEDREMEEKARLYV